MRILHLIHKIQNRGAETFACQLSGHQKKLGHTVEIVAIHNGDASLAWPEKIDALQPSARWGVLDMGAARRLSEFIKNFQPDIIQANSGDTLKFLVFSRRLFGWKSPVVFRNASEVGRYLNSKLQIKFNSFLYKEVARVISVSEASKKDFLLHFPYFKAKTETIPIGLEKNDNISSASLRPEGRKNIIHVGGFSFEKNHQGLIRIFEQILKKNDQVHLHLVGDGPLRPKMEEVIKEKTLQDRISFHGFVQNPLSFIKASDVLVLPSIIEGLPGVLLEAMYCKVPVVAYDTGGISEIVRPGSGNLICKGDENEFSKAVLRNLTAPDEKEIENLYAMVNEKFMNSVISKRFMTVYNDVLKYGDTE